MKLIATTKAEQEHAAIDPWTVVHFGLGLAAGLMNMRFGTTLAANVGFELAESYFQRSEFGQRLFAVSSPENPVNTLADIAVVQLGWWLGRKWNARR